SGASRIEARSLGRNAEGCNWLLIDRGGSRVRLSEGVFVPGLRVVVGVGWPSTVAWALPTNVVFRIVPPAIGSCNDANHQAAPPPPIPSRQQTSQDDAARSEATAPVRPGWAERVRPRLLKPPSPSWGQPKRIVVV